MKAGKIIAGGVAGSLLLLGVAAVIHPGEASRGGEGDAPSREATVRAAAPSAPSAAVSSDGPGPRGEAPLAIRAKGGALPGANPGADSGGGSLPGSGAGGVLGGAASDSTPAPSGTSSAPVPGGLAGMASSSGELAAPPGMSDSDAARIAEMLAVAQRAPSTEERVDAVHWLGRNGFPALLDALLAIQIQDPDAAVRRAAEASANELRNRYAHQPWPGVQAPADPFSYMDEEPRSLP